MNKSESKYFATAVRMDEAFLRLLEKKDFAYITVKNCVKRQVSTDPPFIYIMKQWQICSRKVPSI